MNYTPDFSGRFFALRIEALGSSAGAGAQGQRRPKAGPRPQKCFENVAGFGGVPKKMNNQVTNRLLYRLKHKPNFLYAWKQYYRFGI
ncbi:hypothetical protein SAMN05444377_10662 [Flavobacterium fontis]|uniref:Uncharacterized protein n=1 Tax=Flavobacterium fontis TaxID=1124188 RepID=A0A1M5AGP5_9FLAO|nr:hypothetical protein SAMN05444377_10662 [Flavobacterium fontis]